MRCIFKKPTYIPDIAMTTSSLTVPSKKENEGSENDHSARPLYQRALEIFIFFPT